MALVPFETASTTIELQPSPITPEWILRGNPVARGAELSRSADRTTSTVVWDCTPGVFEWRYHCDETIHILEGSIVLTDSFNPARRLGPGDVVFFPKGSVVHWEVETYVKKVAFLRKVVPNPLIPVINILRPIKRFLKRSAASQQNGLLGAGALASASNAGAARS